MNEVSDTPRTDEHCGIGRDGDPDCYYCDVSFTRQLERELTETKTALSKLKAISARGFNNGCLDCAEINDLLYNVEGLDDYRLVKEDPK